MSEPGGEVGVRESTREHLEESLLETTLVELLGVTPPDLSQRILGGLEG